jgi:hypothetical protein
MLLNDIGKSPDATFRKINQHLESNYGFKITEDVSDKDLVLIMEQIEGEIVDLKIKGGDAKVSPEISKRLLVLEGMKTLREFALMQFQSPDLDHVVQSLSDFVVKTFRISGTSSADFEKAVQEGMSHYRSSQYRFPDDMIEQRVRSDAMTKINTPPMDDSASVIGEGPMLGNELDENNWGHVGKRDNRLAGVAKTNLSPQEDDVINKILANDPTDGPKKGGVVPMTVGNDGQTRPTAKDPDAWKKPSPNRGRFTKESVMKEQANLVKNLRRLLETEVSQAEVMMAAKGFAQELQEMIEKIGRLQNEDLPPVTDQMRETYGQASASQFQTHIYGALQGVMDSLYTAKTQVDDAVSTMAATGQFDAAVDMDVDVGLDAAANGDMGAVDDLDNIAADLETEVGDEFGGADEEEPLGRSMKTESLHSKVVEMKRLIEKAKELKGMKLNELTRAYSTSHTGMHRPKDQSERDELARQVKHNRAEHLRKDKYFGAERAKELSRGGDETAGQFMKRKKDVEGARTRGIDSASPRSGGDGYSTSAVYTK